MDIKTLDIRRWRHVRIARLKLKLNKAIVIIWSQQILPLVTDRPVETNIDWIKPRGPGSMLGILLTHKGRSTSMTTISKPVS